MCRRIKKLNKTIIQIYDAKSIHKHGSIKVKNKYLKIFIREFNLNKDRYFYFYKINKHHDILKKFNTISDVDSSLNTINKLENLYKNNKCSHKRIWQVAMIMKVRLENIKKYKKTLYPNAYNINKRYRLAEKYLKFLSSRTKVKSNENRKKMIFKYL